MSTPLSVPDAIRHRRNVRHFAPDPIDDARLAELIDLTVAAPSSWNFQPWRIVAVRDEERRRRLCDACFRQPQVREAPVTFVFAISHSGWRATMDEVFEIAIAHGAWLPERTESVRQVAVRFQEGIGEGLREYNVKDALIAATHLSLAAESLGLGSAFMNGFSEDKVKAVIGAEGDDDIGVALVMPIGVPAERGQNPGRLPIERVVFLDDLEQPWGVSKTA